MAEFLVEMYVSQRADECVAEATRRVRNATIDLTRDGVAVRFLRTLFVPEDETCFLLFEAEDSDVVRAAAELAGLSFDRIVETMAASALDRSQE